MYCELSACVGFIITPWAELDTRECTQQVQIKYAIIIFMFNTCLRRTWMLPLILYNDVMQDWRCLAYVKNKEQEMTSCTYNRHFQIMSITRPWLKAIQATSVNAYTPFSSFLKYMKRAKIVQCYFDRRGDVAKNSLQRLTGIFGARRHNVI